MAIENCMSSISSSSTKQSLDMNKEVYKQRFCGQANVAEQAHADAYAPKIDAKAEKDKLKDVERLKEEESFAKRHPGIVKALIIASVLLVVGILILAAVSKIKSVQNQTTATGSKLGDTGIKAVGTLAVVGGSLGIVGAGVGFALTRSKDSHTGDMLDKYREDSMKKTIEIHKDLQDTHGIYAKELAAVNGENAVNVAQAQGDAIVDAINNGQVPIKTDGICFNEGLGVCNTPHEHKAVDVYSKYSRKDPSQARAQFGLDSTNKVIIMDNSSFL